MEWILVFICIDLFFIISYLNDIKRDNNDRNHFDRDRLDRIVRRLDEIIDKLDKIENNRSI